MTTTATPSTTLNVGLAPTRPQLDRLAAALHGRVVRPGDRDYPHACQPWNVAVPSTPTAVVQAADVHDVIVTVRHARAHGLRLDVRATGHGAAPISAGTLLLHTGALDDVEEHPGFVKVGAGVRWSTLLAGAPHLAESVGPLCGSAPGVGVVGYLTGGGLGVLARTVGMSSDHVRAFDVVTADGALRRTTPTEDPELFGGLCGGKGALGVVTAVELETVPVAPLYGGCLMFAGEDSPAVLRAWACWAHQLPEQGSTSLALCRLPDLPGVPPPLAGKLSVAVRFAWVGDPDDGRRALQPFREKTPDPVLGEVDVMPYSAIGSIHGDPVDPMPVAEGAELLRALPDEAIDALLRLAGPGADCPQIIVELRLLGGAVAHKAGRPSSLGHRDAAFTLTTIGLGVLPLVDAVRAHQRRVAAEMAPWTTGGILPNFGGALTAQSARRAYPPALLAGLSRTISRFDPEAVLVAGDAIRSAAAQPHR